MSTKRKTKKLADFGSWESPISASLLTTRGVGLSEPLITEDDIYWLEYRPTENGRCTVVAYNHGNPTSMIPIEFSVRSGVHEYGGGAWTIGGGKLFFVNQKDQRIYSVELKDHSSIRPLVKGSTRRYADLQYMASTNSLLAVVEDHNPAFDEPKASIDRICCAGQGDEHSLVSGADFYANPRLSPDGNTLLWLEWFHPNMPWTENELWKASIDDIGGTKVKLAGEQESIFQPQWSPDGEIFYVSDRSNWWNLYKHIKPGKDQPIAPCERECGLPLWQFGMSTWGFLNNEEILAAYVENGIWRLYRHQLKTGHTRVYKSHYSHFSYLTTHPATGRALVIASDGQSFDRLCEVEKRDQIEPLYSDGENQLPVGSISMALPITFDTTDFQQAHGFYYPPLNADYTGAAGEKPPLIVFCHGGPTGSTSPSLNFKIQFWTSRGFAVADINYRGSTGYGREYRLSLNGNWGVYDVDDACAAAEYCVEQGWVDRDKLIIRGSSAGGYTVLSALCFRQTFSAGCSLYGIGDLHALAADTHKFESRYTDTLVAPPDETDIYDERSPIKHVENFSCPTIFFQGMEDRVVPPEQAKRMVSALDKAGFAVSLVTYDDEAHGFRKAKNIEHSLNAELAFYGAIFNISTDSSVKDLEILNRKAALNQKPKGQRPG